MPLRLYIDTYSQEIWRLPTRSPVLRFAFQRGSTETIEVRYVTDGVVVQLPDDALAQEPVGTLSFKALPTSGEFLITPVVWVPSGTGTGTKYTFLPVFTSAALDTLLGTAVSAQAYGEIKWTDGVTTDIAGPFLARIFQNLNRGGESIPGVISTTGVNTLNGITSFTGITASDLPYVPTVAIPAGTGIPYLIRLNGQFVPVYMDAGLADVTDIGQVNPLDYHATTNNKHWTRGL